MTKRKTKRLSKAERALKALVIDLNGGLVWDKKLSKFYLWLGAMK